MGLRLEGRGWRWLAMVQPAVNPSSFETPCEAAWLLGVLRSWRASHIETLVIRRLRRLLPLQLVQEVLQVEAAGVHLELAGFGAGPLVRCAVDVEFDAVAVGIAEVQRLADAVVAGAVEGDAGLDEAAQGVGEVAARGVEDRRVIEAGGAGGGGEPPWLSQVFRPMWWW